MEGGSKLGFRGVRVVTPVLVEHVNVNSFFLLWLFINDVWSQGWINTWRIIPISKWLITMVSKSPNWGYSPSKWPKWLINGGYYLLTNWDDPPSI